MSHTLSTLWKEQRIRLEKITEAQRVLSAAGDGNNDIGFLLALLSCVEIENQQLEELVRGYYKLGYSEADKMVLDARVEAILDLYE